MKLDWVRAIEEAKPSVEAPPVPSLIDGYVLDFDESRNQTIYICPRMDAESGSELYAFDGAAWVKPLAQRFPRIDGRVEGGGYDSARRGVVLWTFAHDHVARRARAAAFIADADGVRPLETNGAEPIPEAEGRDDIGTFDRHGAFAFDRAREVWVCLTRCGVWELDATGAWAKKGEASGVPTDWHGGTGTGTFDPVAKRVVFSVQRGGDGYPILVFTWDGAALEPIAMTGLPKLCVGLFNPAAQLCGHPKHGLVLHVGGRLFAVATKGWSELPAASAPPPTVTDALLSYDPKLDALVLGPGKDPKAGGSDFQRVFYLLHDGTWERHGSVIRYTPLKDASYGNCRLVHDAKGGWYATGSHSLRTWRWNVPNWDEIVDKTVGEKVGGWEILYLLPAQPLQAVTQSGAVFAFDGAKWTPLRKADPAFKKRTDFALSHDGTGRIVVWGGEANGRKLNDTLFLEAGKWRAAKKPSPQPADFKHGNKDSVYVDTTMLWDSALGALVRFGYEEVAILGEDEIWKSAKPKDYKQLIGSRRHGHAPAHDPTTGETLLVDFEHGRVLRFDLDVVVEVATFDFPAALSTERQSDRAPYYALADSFDYDPTTRALWAQNLEDAGGVYRLDLGAVFDHASTLGPRTLPKGATSAPAKSASVSAPTIDATHLYRVHGGKAAFFACRPDTKNVTKATVTSGDVGAKGEKKVVTADEALKLVAAKKKQGFASAADLPRDALVVLAGVPSARVKVGKPMKSGTPPKSRIGGVPSAIAGAAWPQKRKQPMGFLFQIETGALLKKHAGVAVFCSLEGEAASEDGENEVVLLRTADFAKKGKAPDGVAILTPRPLVIEPAKMELDEDRIHALGELDPSILPAFEALQAKKGMQTEHLASKVGGIPSFLQNDVPIKDFTLVAQLDFDSISLGKEWPDAGLAGCVYVFVKKDETDALAFWQYT